MELLQPIAELPSFVQLAQPASPEEVDELELAAIQLGRQNISYEHVWLAVEAARGLWVPVRCNSLRRAVLLASSAINNRRRCFRVWRRGRVVCLRHVPVPAEQLAAVS